MAHEFLSDEWFAAVEALGPPPVAAGTELGPINIVVTGFDDDSVEIHLAGGVVTRGLAEDAPTTITTRYDVAKAVFLKGDQEAAMQAFMAGHVKVEGDMTRLMALSSATPTPEQRAYARSILELTST